MVAGHFLATQPARAGRIWITSVVFGKARTHTTDGWRSLLAASPLDARLAAIAIGIPSCTDAILNDDLSCGEANVRYREK